MRNIFSTYVLLACTLVGAAGCTSAPGAGATRAEPAPGTPSGEISPAPGAANPETGRASGTAYREISTAPGAASRETGSDTSDRSDAALNDAARSLGSQAPEVQFARKTVQLLLRRAKEQNITVEPAAIKTIVSFLTTGNIAANIRNAEGQPSEPVQEANREKYVSFLLKSARVVDGRRTLTQGDVVKFHNRTQSTHATGWFCPCWPIC